MKKLFTYTVFAAAICLYSCGRRADEGSDNFNTAPATGEKIRDSLKSEGNELRAEMESYRIRIRNRLDEMHMDIEAARARRKAERDRRKQKEYDAEISQKEDNRKALQEKLDRMGDNIENEWAGFKRDVDALFAKDHTNYQLEKDTTNLKKR